MNIQQIKAEISAKSGVQFPNLSMVRQFDEQGVKQPWLSHWDNDNRIRVVMHEEVFEDIKSNPAKADLALKKEVVEATDDRAAYTRFVVITPKNIEGTL